MDFREATDWLCGGLSHNDLAAALGVSLASVRQARLRDDAKAHRAPPENWERVVVALANERIDQFQWLVARLREHEA